MATGSGARERRSGERNAVGAKRSRADRGLDVRSRRRGSIEGKATEELAPRDPELLMGMENGLEVCLAVGMLGNDSSMKSSQARGEQKSLLVHGALCGQSSERRGSSNCARLKGHIRTFE